MLVSNLIALAIMISTAATLQQAGVTNIQTAADAAKALEPLAGHFAFAAVRLGIIGTGSAGHSGAGGIGRLMRWAKSRGWKTGLDNMPWQAQGFYAVIGAAVLLGLGIDYSPHRSDQGAVLERGAQRRDRGADDGGDDDRGRPSRRRWANSASGRCWAVWAGFPPP